MNNELIPDWKEKFKDWYISTSGQNYMPYEILEAHIERYFNPIDFGAFIYSENCGVDIKEVDRSVIEKDYDRFIKAGSHCI